MSMSWSEVFEVHRKIAAVYFGGGKIKSMLFSLDRRRTRQNYRAGNTLYFCFDAEKKSSEMALIKTMLEVGDVFRVYEKIAPDHYKDAGLHVCSQIEEGADASNRRSLVIKVDPVINLDK